MFKKYFLRKESEFESKHREWEVKTYGMSFLQYASKKRMERALEDYHKPLFIKQFFNEM